MKFDKYIEFFDVKSALDRIKKYSPSLDEERFVLALNYAAEAHEGQFRKDEKTPYIQHPFKAMEFLINLHADEDTLISCLLHDVPEDTDRTLSDIEELFGSKVAFLVEGVTKLSKIQYQHDMPSRQIESLRKLLLHSAKDLRILLIKLSDRLHNMETLGNIPLAKKRLRIATETMEIYVPIANLLGIRDMKSKLEELSFKYILPEKHEIIKNKLKNIEKSSKIILEIFFNSLKQYAIDSGIDVEIYKRHRNSHSIYKFLKANNYTCDNIDNRVTLKLIVNNVLDCYKMLGVIHTNFAPLTKRFKDYIANPKSNGYRSIHTTIFGVNGVLTEIQIRTPEMDIDAEYGISSHFFNEHDQSQDMAELFSNDVSKSKWLQKVLDIDDFNNNSNEFICSLKSDVLNERINVMNLNGECFDLPNSASVLDFAYAAFPESADYILKAKVNNKIVSITSSLKNMDFVDIIVDNKTHSSASWLDFVNTNLSRKLLIKALKLKSKSEKIKDGKMLLQKALDISAFGSVYNINYRKLSNKLEDNINLKSLENLFESIGSADIKASKIVHTLLKDKDSHGKFILEFKIFAKNKFELSKEIYEILYNTIDDMLFFKGWSFNNHRNSCFLSKVVLKDEKQIGKLFRELEQIDSVSYVKKVSGKGLGLLWGVSFLAIITTFTHSYLLHLASTQISFQDSYPILFTLSKYSGLLFFFIFLMGTLAILEKFFPILRFKKKSWYIIFSIPIIAVLNVGLEMRYAEISINWWIIIIELLAIYAYLIMSYYKFFSLKKKI